MTPTALLLLAAFGCGSERTRPAPAPDPAPAPAAASDPTAADVDAGCEALVEGPQSDGECKTDADCGRGGCGNVVCATVAAAADVMTTCEDRPCFKLLDTCGCHEGRCTWTIRPPASPLP